ncbi:DEAD/DEAH box helicase [Breoghania sp.]|uniref:DEAD/DEAH box helicase n=1 Tax=Breoghania sp. TaxID=2065378 RepID=UPI002AA94427|nr:DEAD/DEAH box helicase [Breoghania sp.]
MIQLRPYQQDARVKLRLALRSSTSVLCVLPTGAGKTVLAAALIDLLFKAGKRVIFAVHRVDLLTQTAKTFKKFNIPFSYVACGHHYNPLHRVYVASISTLVNRMQRIKADYVFVDEAHLSAAAGWSKVAKHYKDLGARLIGLTGSPERLDGRALGDIWDDMVEGPTTRWMIENGHLSTYRAFAPKGIDYSAVHTRNGEFVRKEIEELEQGKAVIKDAARHWMKRAKGLRTIAFCRSVARAQEYAEEFSSLGIPSTSLDGETSQEARRQAFERFANGDLMVIFNCALFCEGFDLSAQVDRDVTIECVMQLAPTQSLARHLQQLGRGLRKKPHPAIILDLVGNLGRLGFPDDEREWSLEGRKKVKREVAVVDCPVCGGAHHPAMACPYCGHVYEGCGGKVEQARINEVDGDLEEVDVEALRRERKREQSQARSLQDLVSLATARGYKSPERWAGHIWTARQAKDQQKKVGASVGW